jgi:hypothetical protein
LSINFGRNSFIKSTPAQQAVHAGPGEPEEGSPHPDLCESEAVKLGRSVAEIFFTHYASGLAFKNCFKLAKFDLPNLGRLVAKTFFDILLKRTSLGRTLPVPEQSYVLRTLFPEFAKFDLHKLGRLVTETFFTSYSNEQAYVRLCQFWNRVL